MRPVALFALSVAACSGPAPTPPRPVAPPVAEVEPAPPDAAPDSVFARPPGIKVTLADVGLEASSLDRTADPCVDFYQFACGGWLAANDIPAGRPGWSRFAALEEKNKAAIKVLLEEAAKGIGADPAVRKLGDYYASCMDEGAIEQAGLASIKPLLDRAAKVNDAASWLAMTIELHKLGVWVVWSVHARPARLEATTTMTYLDPPDVGFQDRANADKLSAYRAHVARTFVLAGMPEAKATAAAADVVAIEGALPQGSAMSDPVELKALAKRIKTVDWKRYFQSVGYEPSKQLEGAETFDRLDRVRKQFTPAQWASYFTYHLIAYASPQLPKRFRDEAFVREKLSSDASSAPDRSEQCIQQTGDALGDVLSQRFVAKYFSSAAKQEVTTLVDALVTALGAHVDAAALGASTKQGAHAKLAKLDVMVGYPETWRSYDFEVRRDDFAGNRTRARTFETLRVLARSGKPVDRDAPERAAFELDAHYRPGTNHVVFSAGLLQAPFFSHDRSVPANFGGLGMVVGHELIHSVYGAGASTDGDGSRSSWWQAADAENQAARERCLADQYSTFEAAPNKFVDGRGTSDESVADLGGVQLALDAYRAERADAGKVYIADGFTEDQQFFLAVGQAWCSKSTPDEVLRMLDDSRAPAKLRVYGALRNLPAFTQAFRCAPGTPMNPTNVCNPW